MKDLSAQNQLLKDAAVSKVIEVIKCDTSQFNLRDSIEYQLSFFDSEENLQLFPQICPAEIYKYYTYAGKIIDSGQVSFELLPFDYRLELELSDSFYYIQDIEKDETTASICIDKLELEKVRDQLFFDRFKEEGDTLFLDVYHIRQNGDQIRKSYEFWQEGNLTQCSYHYFYSYLGPAAGNINVDQEQLKNLSLLESRLDQINFDILDYYSAGNNSPSNLSCYRIRYREYMKVKRMPSDSIDRKLLKNSGLF